MRPCPASQLYAWHQDGVTFSTRAITGSGTRPFRCKLCDAVGVGWNGASARVVVQHIPMAYGASDKDGIHKKWKEKHGIRVTPQTMLEVDRAIDMILSNYKAEIITTN